MGGHRIIRRKEVEGRTGLSRATIYRKVKAGSFPKPLHLTERAVGWLETEVQAFLQARLDERDSHEESES